MSDMLLFCGHSHSFILTDRRSLVQNVGFGQFLPFNNNDDDWQNEFCVNDVVLEYSVTLSLRPHWLWIWILLRYFTLDVYSIQSRMAIAWIQKEDQQYNELCSICGEKQFSSGSRRGKMCSAVSRSRVCTYSLKIIFNLFCN